jgi:DeoR/GlpR family transcriptional regulator of sugar metabolism
MGIAVDRNEHAIMAPRARTSAARRQTIQRQLLIEGAVSVDGLARDLEVSEATVRRDLSAMERDGAIRRTHGGAVIEAPRGADQAFAVREEIDAAAKRAIARASLGLVEAGQTLLMNDGTTVMALARELVAARLALTVVTPGVNIATCLSESPAITAYLVGGRVRHLTLGTSGGFAETMLRSFNADLGFIAAEGLSAREGLSYSYESDATIARIMRDRARTTVVLATARKLGQRDRITALTAGEIDVLVTDCHDEAVLAPLRQAGIGVRVASPDGANLPSATDPPGRSGPWR